MYNGMNLWMNLKYPIYIVHISTNVEWLLFSKFQAKALGNTAITISTTSDFTTTAATSAQLVAAFNKIENVINGYATPSCWEQRTIV